jgi:light-regulated signal transduction histidine kinase (bacteriophytochrome)
MYYLRQERRMINVTTYRYDVLLSWHLQFVGRLLSIEEGEVQIQATFRSDVSYGIIEQHKGRIEVESTQDQGATFHIIIPVRNG